MKQLDLRMEIRDAKGHVAVVGGIVARVVGRSGSDVSVGTFVEPQGRWKKFLSELCGSAIVRYVREQQGR